MHCFLVRHGQVVPPRPGAFYGGCEVPLAPEGVAEARAAARWLASRPLGRLASSPLARARAGAACIAENRGLAVEILSAFREIDRGRWAGRTPEEILRLWPGDLQGLAADPAGFAGHGGESLDDLRRRVVPAWQAWWCDRQRPGDVAVVAHLWPIRAVLGEVLGVPPSRWPALRVPTGSITCIRRDPGGRLRVEMLGRAPEPLAVRSGSTRA